MTKGVCEWFFNKEIYIYETSCHESFNDNIMQVGAVVVYCPSCGKRIKEN
jgi:predicted RNA-binding Zn-ribbon protein involved in translation (DUF1610 family)